MSEDLLEIDLSIMELYQMRRSRILDPSTGWGDGREEEVSSLEELCRMAVAEDPCLENTSALHRSLYCDND